MLELVEDRLADLKAEMNSSDERKKVVDESGKTISTATTTTTTVTTNGTNKEMTQTMM